MINAIRRAGRRSGVAGREDGQTLAETAIVLPLLLVLLVGIVMFANAWRTSQTVTNATREGARFGVVQASFSASEVEGRVRDFLDNSGLDGSEATVSASCQGSCNTGAVLTVTTDYPVSLGPFDRVVGLLGGGSDDQITLSSTTNMRKE